VSANDFRKGDVGSGLKGAFLANFVVAALRLERGVLVHINWWLFVDWCRHSAAPCPLTSGGKGVICSLFTMELTPHTYAHVRKTLCFVCLLFAVTVTPKVH